jgi:PAS domain-containing protein
MVERQLLVMLNSSPITTALLRKDIHIFCNDAYARLLGLEDRKTLLSKLIHDLIHTHDSSI